MKTKWFLISAFALFAGLSFVSCSDDDKDPPVVPKFPTKQEITVEANETKDISFDANMDWKITVDGGSWITIMDGTADLGLSDQGLAGTGIKRTLKVKDSNWGFDSDEAKITMTMGGQSEVIFEITRSGKARELQMYSISQVEGVYKAEVVESILLSFQRDEASAATNISTTAIIAFKANYDWKVSNISEGFSINTEISGLANAEIDPSKEETRAMVTLASSDLTPFPKEGEITITDLEGNNPQKFQIKYEGMTKEDIYIHSEEFGIYGGLNFSKEGTYSAKEGEVSMVNLKVAAKDMKYDFLFMKMENGMPVIDDYTGMPQFDFDPWIEVEKKDDKGNVTISIKGGVNEGAPRELVMYVFQEDMLMDENLIDYLFMEAYISKYGFRISQEGEQKSDGFFVGWGLDQTSVPSGSIVPFSESPDFAGKQLSEIGDDLPENNTYVYSFTNAEIDGTLFVAPYGIQFEDPDKQFQKVDDGWPEISWEMTNIYSIGINGMSISKINNEITGNRGLQLLFFANPADFNSFKVSAALIIVQKP